jgi:hypothetical protein
LFLLLFEISTLLVHVVGFSCVYPMLYIGPHPPTPQLRSPSESLFGNHVRFPRLAKVVPTFATGASTAAFWNAVFFSF